MEQPEDDVPEPVVDGAARSQGRPPWGLITACIVGVIVIAGALIAGWAITRDSSDPAAYCETYVRTQERIKVRPRITAPSSSDSLQELDERAAAILETFDRFATAARERQAAAPPEIADDWDALAAYAEGRASDERLSTQRRLKEATDNVNRYAERYCDLKGDM